ncbi:MAG: class II fructose-bisphosphate aldolase [Candidatus Vogelbacteria bacterium]|nr:class II fructose-bisphosphate aldolase [Candidatus Vogelbacteria bacterium]
MKSLREVIQAVVVSKTAVGHFNFCDMVGLYGIAQAAREKGVPVILGLSESERDFVGVHQAVALVDSLRTQYNQELFLNADHTKSLEKAKEAIEAGFDAVLFDGSGLSYEENVRQTKQVVEYAKAAGREVIVEGELGYIGMSSQVLTDIPVGVDLTDGLTTAEEAAKFVAETGVDLLAPAVGNIHGMLAGRPDPSLNQGLVQSIAEAVKVSLVLHGASGNSPEDIKAAIAAGVAIVHVNTELRVAYRDALKRTLQAEPDEVAPYKILKPAIQAVAEVVAAKLAILS